MSKGNRARIIKILVRRELKSTLYGIGFYAVITFALLISSLVLRNYIQTIKTDSLFISSNPLNYPLYLSILIGSIYLALISTISISKEREDRTLQTLFFGPVDDLSYLIGKYLQQMLSFIIILVFFSLYFLLSSYLINFVFSVGLIKLVLLSIFLGSCIISFGLFLSTLTKQVKTSIIIFISVMFFFLGLQLINSVLIGVEPGNVKGVILYLRNVVEVLNKGISWISPFSYLSRGLEAVKIGTYVAYGKSLLSAIIYTLVFLLLATWNFKSKGVRK